MFIIHERLCNPLFYKELTSLLYCQEYVDTLWKEHGNFLRFSKTDSRSKSNVHVINILSL